MTPTMPLAWGNAVPAAFRTRLYEVVEELRWEEERASWLMAVMAWETRRTFSPSIRAPNSSATGLLQFLRSTAKYLGTTTERLAQLTATQQLEYVRRYFAPMARRVVTLEDLYMAVIWPAGIGLPPTATILRGEAYLANKGLDRNHDGRITKFEATAPVRQHLADGLQPPHVWMPVL